MNIFKRIGAGLRAGVKSIMEKIRPARSIVQKQEPAPEARALRQQARKNAEMEADQRALWAIQHAIKNPEDLTAQQGRKKAIEYLNRAKELSGKGDLQDWNRQLIAERYIKSELSSEAGQAARKEAQLKQFNLNFGLDITPDQWYTMDKLIASPAFQKQKELLSKQYKVVFEAVGDAVEEGVDPVRIEQTLDLYTQIGADDYELFSDIVKMDSADFNDFQQEAMAKIGESDRLEAYEINEALQGLYGRY